MWMSCVIFHYMNVVIMDLILASFVYVFMYLLLTQFSERTVCWSVRRLEALALEVRGMEKISALV
jgi:hypothetical protein